VPRKAGQNDPRPSEAVISLYERSLARNRGLFPVVKYPHHPRAEVREFLDAAVAPRSESEAGCRVIRPEVSTANARLAARRMLPIRAPVVVSEDLPGRLYTARTVESRIVPLTELEHAWRDSIPMSWPSLSAITCIFSGEVVNPTNCPSGQARRPGAATDATTSPLGLAS
jgi:hypothetical protein